MSAVTQPAPDWNTVVADNIRAEMARQRWSGRKLATALGVHPTWVNRRTSGASALDPNDIVLFADVLGLSIAELFGQTENAPTPKGEGQMVPSGRIELPTYSLQADGFPVTPMLPVAANHDDNDSDAIHSVTPIRRFA